MTILTMLSISDCLVYESWKNAPDGSLLQIQGKADASPWVGLKIKIQITSGSPIAAVLRLDDENLGRWMDPRSSAAIDVSDHLEICAANPSARSLLEEQRAGFLYWQTDGAIFMWGYSGDLGAFVCVKGSVDFPIGGTHYELDFSKLYEVGKASLRSTHPN